jgi:hypothetical protein
VTYLARYLRGGPLKHARLVAYDSNCITFTYRVRQEGTAVGPAGAPRMTLRVADFLQRWLLHVPVPQTRVVRCYGLYHHTHAEGLVVCRTALGQLPVEVPTCLDWQTLCAQRGETHPERCPPCGQLLVCTEVLPRAGASRRCWQRHVLHEGLTAGDSLPGAWCACCSPGRGRGSRWEGGGTPQRRGTRTSVPPTGLLVGARGRMLAGYSQHNLHSARGENGGRPHRYAVCPTRS